ncbi:hypothetical protein RRG08_011194 [Elysia crispata]|uniref:Uncharacterized protein n=1 Tax=Elysia crispata TaxID=231223 RepID=A0AAE0YEP8_9GAST|nr:hypothetical protein RRG08_011194 [Elysia crispata]
MTPSKYLALMTLLLLGMFSNTLAVVLGRSGPNEPGYWDLQRPLDFEQGGIEGYADSNPLGKVQSPPVKRHWCPRGMAYSAPLGRCRMSLAAMRGRGRRY